MIFWGGYCIVGGDQMNAKGSQRIRSNSERGTERLEGFQLVVHVEDWHTKVCYTGSLIPRTPTSSSVDTVGQYSWR